MYNLIMSLFSFDTYFFYLILYAPGTFLNDNKLLFRKVISALLLLK